MVDEVDLGTRRKSRELVEHRRIDHLGQGARDLDPGRTAAHDDEVDGSLVREVESVSASSKAWIVPGLQAVRVVEGIERERMLRPGRVEEVRRNRMSPAHRAHDF